MINCGRHVVRHCNKTEWMLRIKLFLLFKNKSCITSCSAILFNWLFCITALVLKKIMDGILTLIMNLMLSYIIFTNIWRLILFDLFIIDKSLLCTAFSLLLFSRSLDKLPCESWLCQLSRSPLCVDLTTAWYSLKDIWLFGFMLA
jgi:hypothetical protein